MALARARVDTDDVGLRPSALLDRLRDERGVALVLALAMTAVLAVTAATVLVFTSASSRESSRSLADQQAHALAEAALANARAVLYSSGEPLNPDAVPQETIDYQQGTATHYGVLSDTTWTLTGIGAVPNPTGSGADVIRTLTSRVQVGGGSATATGENAVWNYIYADSLTTCNLLKNNATINIPLYVRGSLCLENFAKAMGDYVQVGGDVRFNSPNTSIGTALDRVVRARIAGTCFVSGTPSASCASSGRVHAETFDTAPEGLTKPPIELEEWYANAKPGPMHACTSGTLAFDNDGTLNRSRSTMDLMPSAAYACEFVQGSSTVGRIAWTPGNPGTLEVTGTVFFDGDIVLDGTDWGVYDGRGTIYASGRIRFSVDAKLCGVAACDGTWNASSDLLALVAGRSGSDAFLIQNQSKFQGAVYVVGEFHEQNSSIVWGPIVADSLKIENSGLNHPVPIGTLLPGMPSNESEVTVLNNVEGGFGE
jgi:hypothetical protein